MKEIYVVRREHNDKGWLTGDNFFVNANDAIQHMRKVVAHWILYLRNEGYKIDLLHCWEDRVLHIRERIPSQTITFRTYREDEGYGYYDFRVFGRTLYEKWEEIDQSVQRHYL